MSELRVALLYDSHDHPLRPFLTRWEHNLAEDARLDINVFADRRQHPVKRRAAIPLLRSSGRKDRLQRFWRFFLRWPKLASAWLANHHRGQFSLWADFAPLIQAAPEVIHFPNPQLEPVYSGILAAIGRPMVCSFRGYETLVRPNHDPKWRGQLRSLYDRAARLHFVSEHLRQQALSLGAPEEKSVTIRRAVDCQFFSPSPSNQSKEPPQVLHLCSVGRLCWEKGYVWGFHALHELQRQGIDVHWTLIGEGDERDHLAYWVQRFQLEDRVSLLGFQNREFIRDRFRQSAIYLHPSLSEGLPNALLEAAACGLPVVASHVGGIPEAVLDKQTGYLVPPAQPRALADALLDLARHPAKRQDMGRAGRALIEEAFSPAREREQWVALYRDAASIASI